LPPFIAKESDLKEFDQKVAVITGAASGMGRALAVQLARLGCHLALADLNEDGLAETAELARCSDREIAVWRLDVSLRESVYAFVEDVRQTYGQADLLINNAGVSTNVEIEDLDYGYFESLMNINFWGVVYGCKAFLPLLRERPEAHIVNVSSIFAIAAFPRYAAYNAAKAAVRAFTETLAAEMMIQKIPIHVSCVFPGGVGTNIASTTEKHLRGYIAESGYDMNGISEEKIAAAETRAALLKAFYEGGDIATPESAAEAIIVGIRNNQLRILVGDNAREMDDLVRQYPDQYLEMLAASGTPFFKP
jgi:NAD(P)-dependent dehydrogenase (short-subunit alcohol dehydrogenase family)